MDRSVHVFVVLNFLIVTAIVYSLLHYRFDADRLTRTTEDAAKGLYENDATAALLDGSGVYNIPNLRIADGDADLVRANSCAGGPVYLGATGDDSDCVRTCVNDSATAVHVGAGDVFTYESTVLKPGVHCLLGPRPECNMKTTVAMMTVNSVACRTRFPRLFGGRLGGDIVACNNGMINDPKNVLWDYAENRRVDPWRSVVQDEDERLTDGSYRYRCRFEGVNERGNAYTQHPYNRFHPVSNYCADLAFAAHSDVRTVVGDDGFTCDCGDPSVTRLGHLVPGDASSQCSDAVYGVVQGVKKMKRITVPYKCVTLYSPLTDVARYPVCPEDKFLNRGSAVATVEFELTEDESQLIEHPLYKDFTDSGVHTPNDREL